VGDVRGRGYFLGIELVSDRLTKQPFPAQRALSHEIGRRAFENGLICFPCAGNAGDGMGDTIIIAPPFNATDAELAELVDKLVTSVGQVLQA
jgi:adenosylmethionine-8-amino-7-oxononanoate aminotransferase